MASGSRSFPKPDETFFFPLSLCVAGYVRIMAEIMSQVRFSPGLKSDAIIGDYPEVRSKSHKYISLNLKPNKIVTDTWSPTVCLKLIPT